MIPAGRHAVDQRGIAALHGLSVHQARRSRPWAAHGHPAPLTRGRPRRGHPQLWDYEQAAAYAADPEAPVPVLPEPGHPDDLLDKEEAAELAGIEPAAWYFYGWLDRSRSEDRDPQRRQLTEPGVGQPSELVPAPDEEVCGTPHWYRRTVDAYSAERERRAGAPRGGRPAGSTDGVARGEITTRVAELLAHADQTGEAVSVAEVARRLGVNYSTAHKHVRRLRGNSDAGGDTPT